MLVTDEQIKKCKNYYEMYRVERDVGKITKGNNSMTAFFQLSVIAMAMISLLSIALQGNHFYKLSSMNTEKELKWESSHSHSLLRQGVFESLV